MTINYRHGKNERRGTLTRGPAVVIDRRKRDREDEKAREVQRDLQEGGCLHRGGELRREDCPACGGRKVRVKVFACAIHRECTAARKLPSIEKCRTCHEWEPPLVPLSESLP